jgi:hypothetical protein
MSPQFNVYTFFLRLVPWFLRRPIFCAWLLVISKPIQFVVDQFGVFWLQVKTELQYNASVIYLEAALNEEFETDEIYIETLFITPLYLYNLIEERPPFYLYNEADGADPVYFRNLDDSYGLNEFIVWVPASLVGQEAQIAALVDLYCLAGVTYTIQIIP